MGASPLPPNNPKVVLGHIHIHVGSAVHVADSASQTLAANKSKGEMSIVCAGTG